jgi:UDP-N-acetylmuramate dehydrogenase
MIDRLGLKGRCIGDICVYDRHALVLVNRGQGTAEALEQLVGEIQTAVYNEFGVQLETEPQLIKA